MNKATKWLHRMMDLNEMLFAMDEIASGIHTRGSYILHAIAALFLTGVWLFVVITFDLGSTLYVVEQYRPVFDNAFATNPVLKWLTAGRAEVGGLALSSIIIILMTILPSLSQMFLLRGMKASCVIGTLVNLSILADLWTDFPGMHATFGGWPQAKVIPFLPGGGLPPGAPVSAIASGIYSDTIITSVMVGGEMREALVFTPTIWDHMLHGAVTIIATVFVSVSAQICLIGSFVLLVICISGAFGVQLNGQRRAAKGGR